jgi:peptide/nickel transport system ATP-binding protein
VAKKVMSHFKQIAQGGAGILLITHDLELCIDYVDRIVVFYSGTTIEDLPASDFLDKNSLRHPYTKALFDALPSNGFSYIPGNQPYAKETSQGCVFYDRCGIREDRCRDEIPYVRKGGGFVRCVK